MKVSIDAGGRSVEIECPDTNATYDAVADKALEVWAGTAGAGAPAGLAFGLHAEAHQSTNWSTYGPASMGNGERPVAE